MPQGVFALPSCTNEIVRSVWSVRVVMTTIQRYAH